VPYNQSALLKNALIGRCLDVTLYKIPGHTHATVYLDNEALSAGRTVTESRSCTTRTLTALDSPPATYDTIIQFLDRVLVEPATSESAKTTGGGWLAAANGSKLNFGFDVEETDSGLEGDLQLNDTAAGAKIQLSELTFLGPVGADCGSVPQAATSIEFRGTGTYNGAPAEFRVCVQDNGEGEKAVGADLLHLDCEAGCTYDTSLRGDEAVDGGNIQVDGNGSAPDESDAQVSTLILDPVLLTSGFAGAVQQLSVRAYGADQAPLADVPVTLTQAGDDGVLASFTGLTDPTGVVRFTVLNLAGVAEYTAAAGVVQSNTVELTSVAPS
jgi:hypothetical protein